SASSSASVYKPREVVITGSLTTINGKDLSVKVIRIIPTQVKNFSGTYPAKDSVIIARLIDTSKTVRKYSGKADLSELAVGDSVSINGRLLADGTVEIKQVRDQSIHKTFIDPKGLITVVDVAGNNFTIKKGDKETKIFVTSNTKFYKGKSTTPISGIADLTIGDEVKVQGVVRQQSDEINADAITIVTDKSYVDAKKQAAVQKEKTRLENLLANLEKQIQKIKDQLANLK
ncbi:MAG: DUF5666 domain-containing protein, partial [Candidatus Magasanikbacteria bacterium]|nr:DUF5666 domain-containing protein [Candidatus Magasanikbacteria bacterium]